MPGCPMSCQSAPGIKCVPLCPAIALVALAGTRR
ncbi:unnamed protein product, partial [Staurois parvus]